jgi:hypothetical protein
MELELDIEEITKPFISKSHAIETLKKAPLLALKRQFNFSLNELILSTEGFYKYVPTLTRTRAIALFQITQKLIPQFIEINNDLKEIHYFNDTSFEEKFLYSLKVLYKLQSLLHIANTKDLPIQKTSKYIKLGLAKISQEAIAYGISK